LPCPLLRSEDREGWCRASQGESLELCPSIPAGPYGCYCVCCFAWVVRSNRGGVLCAPWMWMMCVSMFPSVRLATCVSSCWLRYLRVGISKFACPCPCGMVCDALAGFSICRCCAVLLCSILCLYWDSIPRACQALYFRVICPTAVRGEPWWGGRKIPKDDFPGRDS